MQPQRSLNDLTIEPTISPGINQQMLQIVKRQRNVSFLRASFGHPAAWVTIDCPKAFLRSLAIRLISLMVLTSSETPRKYRVPMSTEL